MALKFKKINKKDPLSVGQLLNNLNMGRKGQVKEQLMKVQKILR